MGQATSNEIRVSNDRNTSLDTKQTSEILKSISDGCRSESRKIFDTSHKSTDKIEKALLDASGHILDSTAIILDEVSKDVIKKTSNKFDKCDESCRTVDELKACYRAALVEKFN